MWKVVSCIAVEHDLRLVLVAGLVCLIGSATTFRLYGRVRQARGRVRAVWLLFTGAVAGAAVWATHFIAMQAYRPAMETGYEPAGTLFSLFMAFAGMGAAFTGAAYASAMSRRAGLVVGGLLLAAGVGAMHYTGMAAFRTQGVIGWDAGMAAWSLAVGAVLGALAFRAAGEADSLRRSLAGGAVLAAAICAVHFTGMAAMTVTPDASIAVPDAILERGPMTVVVAITVGLILLAALGSVALDAASQNAALNRLREAIDAMPQALAFFGPDDRIVIWNQQYAALNFQGAATLARGVSFRDMLREALAGGHYPEAEGREEEWLEERMAARRACTGPVEQRTADGRWLRIEDQRTADGGTVSICIDVTALKEDAEALAAARDAAEAANRAKSVFLANMSHEIRTPLNGIMGMADVLARSELKPAEREMVDLIRQSGDTLARLLGDILDLSRVESGEIEISPEPFHLAEALRATAALSEMTAAEKGLALKVSIPAEAEGWVLGDVVRVKQVVSNLLSNAVKFTDRGEVALVVQGVGPAWRIEVRDTGVGFDAEARERIFSRFKQADGSITRRFGGSGLGLAISKQLAELMGGDLVAHSTPGVGSTFVLTLPLPAAAAPASRTVEPAAAAAQARSGRLSVLLVDDHAVNRRVVEMMLAHAEVDITSVENGQEAVDAFAAGRFDLVLMDMQMPVKDGLTATREIRLMERSRGGAATPVFLLTANASPEHVEAGRQAGAGRHLTKPISAQALLEAVAEVADRAAEQRAA